jgi:hypothetical protein
MTAEIRQPKAKATTAKTAGTAIQGNPSAAIRLWWFMSAYP